MADGKLVEKVYGKQKVYVIDQVQCCYTRIYFVDIHVKCKYMLYSIYMYTMYMYVKASLSVRQKKSPLVPFSG